MKRRIGKTFNNLPLAPKILCGLLSICCTLTAASGIVYYRHSKKMVEDSIRGQAYDLRERIEREFALYYAAPIEQELHLLVTSPQLNNYLMSSKEEMSIPRADVEQLFLSLSHGRELYRSITFLDASGREKIGTCGNTRIRTFRSLAQRADEGLLGRNLREVFTALQSGTASTLAYSDPFCDAQNQLGFLVGMAKQEPEAGGFGGAVVLHCDLMRFLHAVSQSRILGTAVAWVYGSRGEILSAPPEGELRQDPKPFLTGATAATPGYVYTAVCRFRAGDPPVLTVVCSVPPAILSRELLPVLRSVLVIFSVLLAGSLASSLLISRWISGRIRKLTRAAENVSAQRLDIDLDPSLTGSVDEIGILANAFRTMILDLKESTTSIDNLNNEIAQRQQAQEALRRERDRAQRYLDVAGVMLVALNPEGRITLINREGSRLLGYPEQELLGKDWFETCLPQRVQGSVREIFDRLMAGQIELGKSAENPVRTRSGAERILAWHNTILQDEMGQIVGTLSSGEDITERRQAEKQQTQLLQKLSEINQELKDFAYVVSHDLKAPLRAIRNLADWLATDYQDTLDAQGKETLQLLSSRVDRMQNLIDGVLQYSRVGRTEQGVAPVFLDRLLPEIVENLSVPPHIAIHIESDLPTVEADTTRIMQVFQNLLSNAIKYMDKPQGNITVGCVEEDGFWKFSVCDNGPGIEEKHFERIFKLFQTLAPRDGSESTGVGLTIAKKIVEMYGGRIWVESEVGQGSTFFFTFPKASRPVRDDTLQTCAAGPVA